MKVFVINGFPGSGKTTMEEYCVNYLNQFDKYKNKVHIISSIDSVKQIAKQIGWNGAKKAEDRKFLSDLKKLLKDYNDFPYKSVKRKIIRAVYRDSKDSENHIIFIDSREPEEIKRFKKDFKAKTVCIRRKELENRIWSNESDSNVLKTEYNIYISNDGSIEDFKKNINVFLESEVLNND